jgi:hypothetical protein
MLGQHHTPFMIDHDSGTDSFSAIYSLRVEVFLLVWLG